MYDLFVINHTHKIRFIFYRQFPNGKCDFSFNLFLFGIDGTIKYSLSPNLINW